MKKGFILLYLVFLAQLLYGQAVRPKLLKADSLNSKTGQLLQEGWFIQPADTVGWSTKQVPDSSKSWYILGDITDLTLARNKFPGFEGRCWLKCYMKADSSIVNVPLAIACVHNGASEVYVDQSLVLKLGSFTGNGKKGVYISSEVPSTFVLSDTLPHSILIKYENRELAHYRTNAGKNDELKLRLNTADNLLERFFRSGRRNLILITTAVFFSFSFFHFILFLFYRKDLSNMFFSLFNLAMAVFFLTIFRLALANLGGQPDPRDYLKLSMIAITVAGLALSGLVNNLFDKFGWRFRIILGLGIVATALMWVAEWTAITLLAVTINIILLEVVFLLLRAYLKKAKGAKILAFGILIDFLCLVILTVIFAINAGDVVVNDNQTSAMVLFAVVSVLAGVFIFSIPVSMSVYLAWKTANINKQLGMEMEKVAALSQEKQNILESQKERLEEDVKTRTTELMLQKKKSDDLLLNILPAEVAEELKETGQTKAKHFNQATVLFTDFVNFTKISEQLSAEDLVAQLDECFRAFDEIIERNGLEKIKTIGDAYLAVSGIPVYNEQHAYNTIKAGLEIIRYIESRKTGPQSFEIRIGINSGSLVAGIVGVKKFAYDIWGDTVNMASRMESSGDPGRINISAATYELVKDRISCTYRGKIAAKNKGTVDMYFVDGFTNRNN